MKKKALVSITVAVLLMGVLSIVYFLRSVPPPSQTKDMPLSEASEGTEENPHARAQYKWMLLRDPATNQIPKDIGRRELEFVNNLASKTSQRSLQYRGPHQGAGHRRDRRELDTCRMCFQRHVEINRRRGLLDQDHCVGPAPQCVMYRPKQTPG
jgi:hypothetical protein